MKNPFITFYVFLIFFTSSFIYGQNYAYIIDPARGLYIGNPTIEQATISLTPKGIFMEVGLYLTFSGRGLFLNPNTQYEIMTGFSLPDQSSITDSWLWIGKDIIRAKILDRWKAAQIYESIVNRRRDPSIITKSGKNTYNLRIYPMLGNESRKVKITYLTPISFTGDKASIFLPMELLSASRTTVSNVVVQSFPAPGWTNLPSIPNMAANFEEMTHPTSGTFKAAVLNPAFWTAVSYSLPNPMKNGYYLATYSDPIGTQYYQLAVQPDNLISAKDTGRNLLLVLDYDDRYAPFSLNSFLDVMRNALKRKLLPADSFMIAFASGKTINQTSSKLWQASPENIDRAFTKLILMGINTTNSLEDLLPSVAFLSTKLGANSKIITFSNAPHLINSTTTNDLIHNTQRAFGHSSNTRPMYFGGYEASIFQQYTNNGIYQANSEYLYSNLARMTGGDYRLLISSGLNTSYENLTDLVIDLSKIQISNPEYVLTLSDGFTYGRYAVKSNTNTFLQVGQYTGKVPSNLQITGFVDGKPYFKSVPTITNSPLSNDETRNIWMARYIQSMEAEPQTNRIAAEIIDTSIKYRILSFYTSFLALEPSQGGEICNTCSDTSSGGSTPNESETPSINKNSLHVFPNPMHESTAIELKLATPTPAQDIEIKVYDLLGRTVKKLKLSEGGVVSYAKIIWDGTDEQGYKLPNGVYLIVVELKNGNKLTTKIVIQR